MPLEVLGWILDNQHRTIVNSQPWFNKAREQARRNKMAGNARAGRSECIDTINRRFAKPHAARLRAGKYEAVALDILAAVNAARAADENLPPYRLDRDGRPTGLVRALRKLFRAI